MGVGAGWWGQEGSAQWRSVSHSPMCHSRAAAPARQRHPNGTPELLAQLARRFHLPASWHALLRAAQGGGGSGGESARSAAGADRSARQRRGGRQLAAAPPGGQRVRERSAAAPPRRARAGDGAADGAGDGPSEYESWIYLTQVSSPSAGALR
jgi:hypothetical protein